MIIIGSEDCEFDLFADKNLAMGMSMVVHHQVHKYKFIWHPS